MLSDNIEKRQRVNTRLKYVDYCSDLDVTNKDNAYAHANRRQNITMALRERRRGERGKILVKCFKLRNFEDVKVSISVIRKKSFFVNV